jgi:hypothetical protein
MASQRGDSPGAEPAARMVGVDPEAGGQLGAGFLGLAESGQRERPGRPRVRLQVLLKRLAERAIEVVKGQRVLSKLGPDLSAPGQR